MSSDDEGPVAWLRAQVEARKAAACAAASDTPSLTWTLRMHPSEHVMIRDGNGDPVVYDEGVPGEEQAALMVWNDPLDTIARCEAELAILDRCEALLPPDPEDLDEHYQDGRDDDEIMRDEALAELAEGILALLADGYRHREGWAGHWACPGCGKSFSEVSADHCLVRSTPLDLRTGVVGEPGPWTCQEIRPLSPEEFIASASTPGSTS